MTEFRVEITIDVGADTPREAAQQPWKLLKQADAPVCDLFPMEGLGPNEEFSFGNKIRVDLMDPDDEGTVIL